MNKLSTLVMMTAMTTAALAAGHAGQQSVTLQHFNSVSVQDGFNVVITCGKSNALSMTGKPEALKTVSIKQDNDKIKIERHDSFDIDRDVTLTFTTTKPIKDLKVDQGVLAKVAACAVNTKKINISISRGAKVLLKGKTQSLHLEMHKGAMFGSRHNRFIAHDVAIYGNSGVQAHLCSSTAVEGSVSKGAFVYVGKATQTANLNTSWGASIRICH